MRGHIAVASPVISTPFVCLAQSPQRRLIVQCVSLMNASSAQASLTSLGSSKGSLQFQPYPQRWVKTSASQQVTVSSSTSDTIALGVVIVDHGSKRKASNDMLFEFVDLYKQVTGRNNVQPAHMELAEPTILQAVAACIQNGAQRVVIAPYFLSKGRHIQDDIPALVREAQEQYPYVECVMANPIGVDAMMAKIIDSRVQAVEG